MGLFIGSYCLAEGPIYWNRDAKLEDRVEDLLSRMTLEEKAKALAGTGFDTVPNERLGVPALHMADGPVGVRAQGPATAYPASVCIGLDGETRFGAESRRVYDLPWRHRPADTGFLQYLGSVQCRRAQR